MKQCLATKTEDIAIVKEDDSIIKQKGHEIG
jgi:hypothetical protein